MQKKIVLALLMTALLAGGVFAQSNLSVGGGIILGPTFGETKVDIPIYGRTTKDSGFDFGINAFFDAKFVEVNLGLLFNSTKQEDDDKSMDSTYLTLGVLGKYPFSLSDKVALFPFVGLDLALGLGAKYNGEELPFDADHTMADYMNRLQLAFGVGLDFNLTEALFLRGEVGYAIVFNSKDEADYIKEYKDHNIDVTITRGRLPLKIAVGYRF
jgi:opacity protein-like surface antigen